MPKGLIRLFAFFGKELSEVRRQPRLVLSLILGPSLILLAFGLGYRAEDQTLKAVVVVPPDQLGGPHVDALVESLGRSVEVIEVTADQEAALGRLRRGEADVVEILPHGLEETVLAGRQAPVEFKTDEINPLDLQWARYLAYVQVIELNKTILEEGVRRLQGQAAETHARLAEARAAVEALEGDLSVADAATARGVLLGLGGAVGTLAASPLLSGVAGTADAARVEAELEALQADLAAIETAFVGGTLDRERARLASTRQRIVGLEETTARIASVPPEVVVSPLAERVENLRGEPFDLMTFYAPGVLALILQHIAITLGGLSLVLERLRGSVELFRVAPVSLGQVLVGKYLAHTFFLGLITAGLLGAMRLVGVPFAGQPLDFALVALLFILASLGIGFGISTFSGSDSQAVQLSMLVLLASIFFSGFFLPLETFLAPVRALAGLLPLTHAIPAFQTILLRGGRPAPELWAALGALAAAGFAVSLLRWRRASWAR